MRIRIPFLDRSVKLSILLLCISLLAFNFLGNISGFLFFSYVTFYLIASWANINRGLELAFLMTVLPILLVGILPRTNAAFYWPIVVLQIIALALFKGKGQKHQLESAKLNIVVVSLNLLFLVIASRLISPIDYWAWQLRGDAMNFIVSTRVASSDSSIFEATIGNGEANGLPIGSSVFIQWFSQAILDITFSPNSNLALLSQSFLSITIFAWLIVSIKFLDLGKNDGLAVKLLRQILVTSFFLSAFVGGLTMFNGFLSIPPTVAFLFLGMQAIFLKPGAIFSPIQSVFLFTNFLLLFLTWSLISVLLIPVSAFMYYKHLTNRSADKKTNTPKMVELLARNKFLGHFLVVLSSSSFVLILNQLFNHNSVKQVLLRSGAFPNLDFLFYCFYFTLSSAIVFFCSRRIEESIVLILLPFLFLFALGLFYLKNMSFETLTESLSSEWISPVYYLEKSFIIIVSTLVLLAIMCSLNSGMRFMGILMCFASLIASTPSPLWNISARQMVSYEGIEKIISMKDGDKFMFLNYGNWPGDAYLNSLSGLNFESYPGHFIPGQQFYKATTFMPEGSFSSRFFYTTERSALCTGQSILGESGLIFTSDTGLETKLKTWCHSKRGYPKVVLVETNK